MYTDTVLMSHIHLYQICIILMISLKDEIKKFQKLIYNKQLAEFVTVDQMFVGGGITIESMIHESNFIVEQLKKMNAVFLNFCKLNEKVYTKIMEHQLNIHNEQSKMNSVTGSLDRKIEETMKAMKKLHEDTVGENRRSLEMIGEQTSPIWKELEKKVDKVSFQAQMKKFLEEYDGNQPQKEKQKEKPKEDSQEEQGPTGGKNNEGGAADSNGGQITQETGSAMKKKGKVGFDQFYKLQAQLQERLKASQQRLQNTSNLASQGKEMILKYIPVINKNMNELSMHTTDMYKLNVKISDQDKFINTAVQKLHQELNHRTNDQIWNLKFQQFFDKQLKPTLNNIDQSFKAAQKQAKHYRQETNKKIHAIQEEYTKVKMFTQNLQAGSKRQGKDIQHLTQSIQQHYQQFLKQKTATSVNIENFKTYSSLKFKDLEQMIRTDIDNVKKIIEGLIQKIEESVLKAVTKKVDAQIKAIEQDIRSIQVKAKGLRSDIVSICEEIQNMKEMLSKKANFTDIIHQVEKKADREDFRELETKFNETSQQFVSKNLNESLVLGKLEKNQKARSSSLNRASKTLLAPRLSPNRLNKTDFDISTKLFMCGLDTGHIGQNRVMMSQNSRRKSLKSSVQVISDLVG